MAPLEADRPPAPDLERLARAVAEGELDPGADSLPLALSRPGMFRRFLPLSPDSPSPPESHESGKAQGHGAEVRAEGGLAAGDRGLPQGHPADRVGPGTSPDLSLYNRVGDLYLKTNDTASAVRSYERAVDLYADQGFFNNAIALCGKILRVNPGRTQTYLKLAQLHARKNVVIEAKRNLIEFLERMNALGQLDQAFQSVNEFADQFSGSQEIRLMLVELLRAASREDEAREQLEKLAGEIEGRDRPDARRSQEFPRSIWTSPRRPGAGARWRGWSFSTRVSSCRERAAGEEVVRIIEAPPPVEPEEAVAPAEGLILPETIPEGKPRKFPAWSRPAGWTWVGPS